MENNERFIWNYKNKNLVLISHKKEKIKTEWMKCVLKKSDEQNYEFNFEKMAE